MVLGKARDQKYADFDKYNNKAYGNREKKAWHKMSTRILQHVRMVVVLAGSRLCLVITVQSEARRGLEETREQASIIGEHTLASTNVNLT